MLQSEMYHSAEESSGSFHSARGAPTLTLIPPQGRGHSMLQTQMYQSEEDTSGSFHSEGLTGAAFNDTGMYYPSPTRVD